MAASRTQTRSSAVPDEVAGDATLAPMSKGVKAKGKGKESIPSSTEPPVRPSSIFGTEMQENSEGDVGDVDDEPWVWTTLADSSVSNRPALFTLDGR